MKRWIALVLCLPVLLFTVSCSGNGVRKSPIGSFAFGSTAFTFDGEGNFRLEHTTSSEDKQHYIMTGTFIYTLDHTDTENEISYGKLDITVKGITIDGATAKSLDFTTIHSGTDVTVGETFLGWWKYMNLVTYAGRMLVEFNLPFHGYRPEDVDTGRDVIIRGDPVK